MSMIMSSRELATISYFENWDIMDSMIFDLPGIGESGSYDADEVTRLTQRFEKAGFEVEYDGSNGWFLSRP